MYVVTPVPTLTVCREPKAEPDPPHACSTPMNSRSMCALLSGPASPRFAENARAFLDGEGLQPCRVGWLNLAEFRHVLVGFLRLSRRPWRAELVPHAPV